MEAAYRKTSKVPALNREWTLQGRAVGIKILYLEEGLRKIIEIRYFAKWVPEPLNNVIYFKASSNLPMTILSSTQAAYIAYFHDILSKTRRKHFQLLNNHRFNHTIENDRKDKSCRAGNSRSELRGGLHPLLKLLTSALSHPAAPRREYAALMHRRSTSQTAGLPRTLRPPRAPRPPRGHYPAQLQLMPAAMAVRPVAYVRQ